jgi:hypothetical protein
LLQVLPDVPPELAVWAKVKVHRDAHQGNRIKKGLTKDNS